MKYIISEDNLLSAVAMWLRATSTLRDEEVLVSIKRTRGNEFELEIEKED